MDDLISRQAAIDAHELLLKDCNPDHFVAHEKFIGFMDDTEIGSFGDWQFANGFNLALTAGEVAIKEQPSAERKGKWIWMGDKGDSRFMCSVCKSKENVPTCNGEPIIWEFCPNCGAKMDETVDE